MNKPRTIRLTVRTKRGLGIMRKIVLSVDDMTHATPGSRPSFTNPETWIRSLTSAQRSDYSQALAWIAQCEAEVVEADRRRRVVA